MKAEYKRDLQCNYLILEVPDGMEEDTYQIQMAEKNEISGLLVLHSSRKNGHFCFHYEITSKQSLESFFDKKAMKSQDIVLLLAAIREVLDSVQEYLLNPARLLFDPKYIYFEPERQKYYFCYFPSKGDHAPIWMLAEFILKKLNHEDTRTVRLGYSFYQQAMEENFSLQKTLKELMEATYQDTNRASAEEMHAECQHQSLPEMDWMEEEREGPGEILRPKRSLPVHPVAIFLGVVLLLLIGIGYGMGYLQLTEAGGLFFIVVSFEGIACRFRNYSVEKKYSAQKKQEEEIMETECLVSRTVQQGLLLYPEAEYGRGISPIISLRSERTIVGKIKGESEVVLDSPTVSRRHACLECRNGRYYVKDLNSRNGTFLNGDRLEPMESREFREGDRIAFAEVVYFARNQ